MIVTHSANLPDVISFIQSQDVLSVDIETTSLNPRTGQVLGVGISNQTQAYYLAHLAWSGDQLEQLLTKDEVSLVLSALVGKKLTGWNLSFDFRYIYNYFKIDLIPSLWSDGMLAKHTVEEDPEQFGNFALKDVAARVYGAGAKDEQADLKASIKANGGSIKQFFKADLDVLAKYCMQDCILAYKLNELYVQKISDEGLTKFYFEDEVIPLYKEVTIPMELHGVPVDVELLQASDAAICADISKLQYTIQAKVEPLISSFTKKLLDSDFPHKRAGVFAWQYAKLLKVPLPITSTGQPSISKKAIATLPEDDYFRTWIEGKRELTTEEIQTVQRSLNPTLFIFNLQSKNHLRTLFFNILKESPAGFTDKGVPQVNEDFLESIKSKYDFVPLLIEFNKLSKIKSSYIERLLHEQEGGIWYPAFQQHRTISGRYGSDAQQLPRPIDDEDSPPLVRHYTNLVRSFLLAPQGYKFIGADYESLEPKIFAHVSGDEGLKNIYRLGHDFYSTIAIATEKLSNVSADKKASNYLGKVNKSARQNAKAYALGVPYGLSGYKLQFYLNIEQDLADQLVEDYLSAFPDLHAWMRRTHADVKLTGKVRSEAGRVRHMPEAAHLYAQYGDRLLDSLWLWKNYHTEPDVYIKMKQHRRRLKNYLNNACNFQIQSLAASIVNRACIKMSQSFKLAGLTARVSLQVHDEVVILCPEVEVEQVSALVKQIMETNYTISVPLLADPNVGTRYSETK